MIFCTGEVVPSVVRHLDVRELGIVRNGEVGSFVPNLIHLVARLELEGLVELLAVQRIADLFGDRAIREEPGELE